MMLRFLHQRTERCFVAPLRVASIPSILRFLSTPIQPQPQLQEAPSPSQLATQYLVESCGLSPERATRASKCLPHFKSPQRSDSVLHFLRQAGVVEPHIRAAAIRDASFLYYNVENCLKPRVAELSELGFSPSQISLLISVCPAAFRYTNMKEKVQFWLGIFGSVDTLLRATKRNYFLLTVKLESYVLPKLSVLRDQCGLSVCQIARLISLAPRLITLPVEDFQIKLKRLEELEVPRSSGIFIHALAVVCRLNLSTLDAKLLFFTSLGFSEDEYNP